MKMQQRGYELALTSSLHQVSLQAYVVAAKICHCGLKNAASMTRLPIWRENQVSAACVGYYINRSSTVPPSPMTICIFSGKGHLLSLITNSYHPLFRSIPYQVVTFIPIGVGGFNSNSNHKAFEAHDAIKSNIQVGFSKLPDAGSPMHINILREWIQDCDTHQCLGSPDTRFLPTRLLDVGDDIEKCSRLICDTSELPKTVKYLALSHRWGSYPEPGEPGPLKGKTICLYARNMVMLKEGINDSDFPPKYQDAITVARQLKVHYIWIDSLCVIQQDKSDPLDKDKGKDWANEAERMEQVFRSAYATIAACCANSPAEHFFKRRPERQCVTMQADNAFYYLCNAIDNFSEDVEQGELAKRGWVLQERALSRRTIYFTEKQTYWECGEGVRCETLTKTKKYERIMALERF